MIYGNQYLNRKDVLLSPVKFCEKLSVATFLWEKTTKNCLIQGIFFISKKTKKQIHELLFIEFHEDEHLEVNFFTSGDLKAILTVHHVSVDPQGVPSFQITQSAFTHLTLPNTSKHSRKGHDTR